MKVIVPNFIKVSLISQKTMTKQYREELDSCELTVRVSVLFDHGTTQNTLKSKCT